MTSEPTIFVVDDDPAICDSLRWLVESVGLKAEAHASAHEFLEVYDTARPGCLVLDVRMPGMGGLDLLDELKARGVDIPVIVVTGYGDVPTAVRAMKAGAVDFIEKPFSQQVLLDLIQQCLEEDARNRREQAIHDEITARIARLSPRQREVMDLVVVGKPSKEIGRQLGISPKTVEAHRAHLMKTMRAANLAELVTVAHAGAQCPRKITSCKCSP